MPDQPVSPEPKDPEDPAPNSGGDGVFGAATGGVPDVGQGAHDAARAHGDDEPLYDEEPAEHVPGSFLAALPQFFVFPLILVVSLTAIYLLVRLLAGASDATAPELLAEIRTAGSSERWFLLHELAQGLNTGRLDLEEVGSEELRAFYAGTLASIEADPQRGAREREELRYALLLVLGAKQDPALAELAHEALGSSSETVRYGALRALGALKNPASLERIEPLLDSPVPLERRLALDAVGLLGTSAARDELAEQLRSSDPAMVRGAAVWLGNAGDPRAKPVVMHLLDREAYGPDGGVPAAFASLDESSRPAARDQYVEHMLILACRAAARLGDPAFVPALRALRRGDRSMKVKSAALDALHDMGVDPETS